MRERLGSSTDGLRVLAVGRNAGVSRLAAATTTASSASLWRDELVATTGGSEAILFAFLVCADAGDEILVVEPFYTNYRSFATMAGVTSGPCRRGEDGFHLPPREVWERALTPRTRLVLLCNPNNPTGTVYTDDELRWWRSSAATTGSFSSCDEVYREFVYDGRQANSALAAAGLRDERRRRGQPLEALQRLRHPARRLVTRNRDVYQAALRMAQGRLSPPGLAQFVAVGMKDLPPTYTASIVAEYQKRRDLLFEGLRGLPGVFLTKPEGAFYFVARLPVDDSEDFARLLLADFELDGRTVMVAPASGFYATPGLGSNEVRIAYVLKEEDLRASIRILGAALEALRPPAGGSGAGGCGRRGAGTGFRRAGRELTPNSPGNFARHDPALRNEEDFPMTTELALETQSNYIGGKWVPAASGKTFEDRNPADKDDLVGVFAEGGAADVEAAVAAAKKAFPAWRDTPAPRRAEILYAAGRHPRARQGEARAAHDARDGEGPDGDARRRPGGHRHGLPRRGRGPAPASGTRRRRSCRTSSRCRVRQPIGVCAFVTPWNFPMAIPAWKSMAALIVRQHDRHQARHGHAALGRHFARVLEEAGLPPGVFNVVTGGGAKVGDAARHASATSRSSPSRARPRSDRRINDACAPTFKHVHLEMGGKNAILVMDDADVELAVDGAVWGAFGTTGQRCTASSRLLVHKKVYDDFSAKLAERANDAEGRQRPRRDDRDGPVRQREASSTRSRATSRSERRKGAKLVAGGRSSRDGQAREGLVLRADGLRRRDARMRIAREEIFGPVTTVVPIGSLEEGIRIANAVRLRALVGSIYTRDVNKAFTAMRDFETGIFYVNSSDDRRRGPPAVRRHQGHRQRPPRGGHRRPRRVHGVEVDLRGLLGTTAEGADRHARISRRRRRGDDRESELFGRFVCLLAGLAAGAAAPPAGEKADKAEKTDKKDDSLSAVYGGMEFRNIGPFRGGRVDAVTGVRGQPLVFYFGGDGRRRLEDGRRRLQLAADVRQGLPDGLGRRDRRRRVRPERRLRREWASRRSAATSPTATACTSRPTAGKTWINVGPEGHVPDLARPRPPEGLRTSSTSRRTATSGARTPSAASSGRRTAARPGRRSSSYRDKTGASDLVHGSRRTRASSTPASGRCTASPGRSRRAAPSGGLYQSTDGGDTWKKLARRAARGRRRQHRRRHLGRAPRPRSGRSSRPRRAASIAPTTAARSGRA